MHVISTCIGHLISVQITIVLIILDSYIVQPLVTKHVYHVELTTLN